MSRPQKAPSTSVEDMLTFLLGADLDPWERSFVENVWSRFYEGHRLTPRQIQMIGKTFRRCLG